MTAEPSFFWRACTRLWGFLAAAGFVACLATVMGFLGRFSWFLDLFSHFRVQYAMGLLALGGLMIIGRRRRTGLAFLAFACANLVVVLPIYFGRQAEPPAGTPRLRAMLINVNTHMGDPGRVGNAVAEADPDILVLEEVSAGWIDALSSLTNKYRYSVVQPRDDNFGIALFSKLPIIGSEVVYVASVGTPFIFATVDTGHGSLRVVCTHPLPPSGRECSHGRNEQLERLPAYTRSHLPVLLLGDLNVTPWNYHFRRLLTRTGLRDSARGFGVQPTWPSNNPLLLIPIDHCLHSKDITIVGRAVGCDVSSDHYPLIVDFVIGEASAPNARSSEPVCLNAQCS